MVNRNLLIPIYLVILLFITLLCLEGLSISLMYTPIKIRILISGVFIGLFLKFVLLLCFSIIKNIRYLYLFEPIYFIGLLCIPTGALIVLYIFIRQTKVKVLYIIAFSIIFLAMYIFCIINLDVNIQINKYNIYFMYFDKQFLINIVYGALNLAFLVFAFLNIKNAGSIKLGLNMVMVSSTITIAEIVCSTIGIKVFSENIFGDLFWCITIIYAISKLKNK
jgi:hypothetical protein